MKVILDDKRAFPVRGYNCFRGYNECILMIGLFPELEYISLDYDLGEEHTGFDVLMYMKEHGTKVAHINLHSDHPIGVQKMREYAEEHFPDASVTFNKLS